MNIYNYIRMRDKLLVLLISIGCSLFLTCCHSGGDKPEDKALIVYFSVSQARNTCRIAQIIHRNIDSDICELKVIEAYPEDMEQHMKRAKFELNNHVYPKVAELPFDIADYNRIYIGYPNWFGTIPMPVVGFLKSNDWTGKKIMPFLTHGTGGRQNCFSDLNKYISKAEIASGFSCVGSEVAVAEQEVLKWLADHHI